jgi:nucleoside-diphosphate-sugar epimerase
MKTMNKRDKKKIFITGGMGYIGSHLAKEAIRAGHKVMLYDSLIYEQDYEKMLKEIGNARFVFGDTRNENLLRECLEDFKPDYVCHFAEFASVYAANHNPRLTSDNNYITTKNVLALCEKLGIKVLWNSSSSVYGTQRTDKFMTESDKLPTPTDNYVKHKLLIEKYIRSRPKLKIIVFRPATIFGIAPRLRIDLLANHFTYMAIAKGDIKIFDGKAHRACLDINELSEAYLKVIEKGIWKSHVYNLGHHNMTKQEYAEGVRNVIDCKLDASSDITDPRNLKIDCSKFNDEFDFYPQTSYEASIKKVAMWIKKNLKTIEENKFIGILTMPYDEWLRMCK